MAVSVECTDCGFEFGGKRVNPKRTNLSKERPKSMEKWRTKAERQGQRNDGKGGNEARHVFSNDERINAREDKNDEKVKSNRF